jgi:hypothetical protein
MGNGQWAMGNGQCFIPATNGVQISVEFGEAPGEGGTRGQGDEEFHARRCVWFIWAFQRHPKLSRVDTPVTGLTPSARLHINFTS